MGASRSGRIRGRVVMITDGDAVWTMAHAAGGREVK
jgi:hypothetical protein